MADTEGQRWQRPLVFITVKESNLLTAVDSEAKSLSTTTTLPPATKEESGCCCASVFAEN
ncbi:uncharacterized protein V6R79_012924 [Siganus canaliculatus]